MLNYSFNIVSPYPGLTRDDYEVFTFDNKSIGEISRCDIDMDEVFSYYGFFAYTNDNDEGVQFETFGAALDFLITEYESKGGR
jgi:hypothetical protein